MKSRILATLFLAVLIKLDAADQPAARPPAGTGGLPALTAPVGQSNPTRFITNSTQPMLQFDVRTTNQLGQLTNPFGPGMNPDGSGAGQFGLATNPVAFDTNFLAVHTNTLGNLILLNGSGQFDISANGSSILFKDRADVLTNVATPTGFTNFPNRIFANPTNMLQLNPNR